MITVTFKEMIILSFMSKTKNMSEKEFEELTQSFSDKALNVARRLHKEQTRRMRSLSVLGTSKNE